MKFTIENVTRLYPNSKIICVEEYFTLKNKWTSLFNDGTDVRDPDLYFKYGLNFVIAKCIADGATQINFKLIDEDKNYTYPDFKVEELDEQPFTR